MQGLARFGIAQGYLSLFFFSPFFSTSSLPFSLIIPDSLFNNNNLKYINYHHHQPCSVFLCVLCVVCLCLI